MTTGAGVDAHTANPWHVGFCGFAPGFAYLVGGDPRLAVPRRSEPARRFRLAQSAWPGNSPASTRVAPPVVGS